MKFPPSVLVRDGVMSIKIVYIDDVLFSYRLDDEAATVHMYSNFKSLVGQSVVRDKMVQRVAALEQQAEGR